MFDAKEIAEKLYKLMRMPVSFNEEIIPLIKDLTLFEYQEVKEEFRQLDYTEIRLTPNLTDWLKWELPELDFDLVFNKINNII